MVMKVSFYKNRFGLKWILFFIAVILLLAVFFFLSTTINGIRKDERKKVMLWAEAVQQRSSLLDYTSILFEKLQKEELQKVEVWREAQQLIMEVEDPQFLTFLLRIISNNKDIPIILTDQDKRVITTMNLDVVIPEGSMIPLAVMNRFSKYKPLKVMYKGSLINYLYYSDSQTFYELQVMINNMIHSFISEVSQNAVSVPVVITNGDTTEILAYGNIEDKKITELTTTSVRDFIISEMQENQSIPITLVHGNQAHVFYQDSELISKLKYYPLFLFVFIVILITGAYLMFRSSANHEKDQLWVGMSKETAHQLGTPISSLMAWVEILKMRNTEPEIIDEINKDVSRLQIIAERFSKIGSETKLTRENLITVVENSTNYMKKRSSKNVSYSMSLHESEIPVMLNTSLLSWVIENIWKNAVDAMQGSGTLTVEVFRDGEVAYIDISDTGKGLPRSKFKTIFTPGYTTKKRGWGLGLSLAQRIIQDYHHGKIIVKSSEIDKGTTMRIILPVCSS